jgi:hypothetical protein
MLFAQKCRKDFKELTDAYDTVCTSKILGNVWRYLSKRERMIFYQEAQKQRQLYCGKSHTFLRCFGGVTFMLYPDIRS